jgi:hypothetical protein
MAPISALRSRFPKPKQIPTSFRESSTQVGAQQLYVFNSIFLEFLQNKQLFFLKIVTLLKIKDDGNKNQFK